MTARERELVEMLKRARLAIIDLAACALNQTQHQCANMPLPKEINKLIFRVEQQ